MSSRVKFMHFLNNQINSYWISTMFDAGYIDSENLAYGSRGKQDWVDSNITLGKLFQG